MKVTAISDLHGDKPALDGGDLLIIAGDLTARDLPKEYPIFMEWLEKQQYKHKVVIAGNHDEQVEQGLSLDFPERGIHYLQDSGVTIEGLKIWGTPWTRYFEGVNPDCDAFMLRSEFQLQDKFDQIPEDTDILVTHGPCYGRLDETLYRDDAGSKALRSRVDFLRGKRLRYHIHGHIHEAYGVHEEAGLTTLNVSRMNRDYNPINKIVNFELR